MSTIKTTLREHIEQGERALMQAQIDELTEALKVAQEENATLWKEREEPLAKVALYVSECNRLETERDALQAKLSALEKQEPVAVVQMERPMALHVLAGKTIRDGMNLYAAPVAPVDTEIIHKNELQIRVEQALDRLLPPAQPVKLDDIEQYRMQMAGISTAAIGYWKEGDNIHPDYDTVALRDVAKLYAKYDELYKAAQPLTKEQVKKVLDALNVNRIMGYDEDGNCTREITPKLILEAIEIMKGVRG